MEATMNYIASMQFEKFALAFCLIAIILEVVVCIAVMETYRAITKWYRLRRLDAMDEFEYMNDLY